MACRCHGRQADLLLQVEYQAGSQRHSSNVKPYERSLRWCPSYPAYGEHINRLENLFLMFYVAIFRKSWVLSPWYLTQTPQANDRHWIGGISLGRYNKNPRMRVQKAENVNMALEFITSRGVKLTNIGPEGPFPDPFHYPTNFPLLARYHWWKPQTHPWHDMDTHSSLHNRRHQVRHISLPFLIFSFFSYFLFRKRRRPLRKRRITPLVSTQDGTLRRSRCTRFLIQLVWWTCLVSARSWLFPWEFLLKVCTFY